MRVEGVVVRLDEPPWAWGGRVIVGYFIVPLWVLLTGGRGPDWTVVPFFLGSLVMLRVAPALTRRLLAFSDATRAKWAERRQLALRFDSYQWQKLFWVGLGLAVYMLQSGLRSVEVLALTVVSLIAGALGLVRWTSQLRQLPPRPSP